jgi:hypothetical protein|tara:strand:+ start:1501 stop:2784 length:1284 start_codon:yes stop_codon:yes gene_type:complete
MSSGFGGLNQGLNNSNSNTAALESINELKSLVTSVRVVDIVLDEKHPEYNNVGGWNGMGTIFFEQVGKPGTKFQNFQKATPLIPNINQYPIPNELVLCFRLPNREVASLNDDFQFYYLNPISIWNHPHHNAYPAARETANPIKGQSKNYSQIESGQINQAPLEQTSIQLNPISNNGTFVEKSNIQPLLPFSGDVITQGRYGNSIRLGSTAITDSSLTNNWSSTGKNGDPIVILRNGVDVNSTTLGYIPTTENINRDFSSIYLTSTQTLPLVNSIENYKAFKNPPILQRLFNKPQIALNSGRIIFNTTSNDIILTSKQKIALSAEDTIGVTSKKEFVVDANNIKLGSRFANQPIILGADFMDQFEQLLISIKNLSSTLENLQDWPGGIPVPSPIVPPMATATKAVIEEILNLVTDEKSPLLSSKSRVE